MENLLLFIALTLLSLGATGLVLKVLRQKAILDQPNERSSHTIPTPRGGGLGILLIALPSLTLITLFSPPALSGSLPALIGLLLLAILSWLDDLYTLGPAIRFALQICCVLATLYFMPFPSEGLSADLLPIVAEKIILGIAWVWFINAFNFMDGIDGISGMELLSISGGILILALFTPLLLPLHQSALTLGACALGFLWWNWHKAKVFMGDVGSIPLGFLVGWLLINLALQGHEIAALILPLYYLMDASLTLLNRLRRGEKIWRAHKEHFYQKAHQSGLRHDQIVIAIGLLNISLIGCAVLSLEQPILALCVAIMVVSVLLWHFQRRFSKGQSKQ